jgi:hypothetical protein
MAPNGNVRWYFDDKRGIVWFAVPEDSVAWILDSQRGQIQDHAKGSTMGDGYLGFDAQAPFASKFPSQRSHLVRLRREMHPKVEEELLRGANDAGRKNREIYTVDGLTGLGHRRRDFSALGL